MKSVHETHPAAKNSFFNTFLCAHTTVCGGSSDLPAAGRVKKAWPEVKAGGEERLPLTAAVRALGRAETLWRPVAHCCL